MCIRNAPSKIPLFLEWTSFALLTSSSLLLQVVLCQINIFCDRLFTQIVLEFKTQYLQGLNFRTIPVNLTKSVFIFWIDWWQNMLIWQRITCTSFLLWECFCKQCFVHPRPCSVDLWLTQCVGLRCLCVKSQVSCLLLVMYFWCLKLELEGFTSVCRSTDTEFY